MGVRRRRVRGRAVARRREIICIRISILDVRFLDQERADLGNVCAVAQCLLQH